MKRLVFTLLLALSVAAAAYAGGRCDGRRAEASAQDDNWKYLCEIKVYVDMGNCGTRSSSVCTRT